MGSRIYIETYGCAAAQGESEIMAGLLSKVGFDVVNKPDIADLIIISSCIVKIPTEQKILFRIEQIQKKYPEKKLIIGGCGPEGARDRFVAAAPNASLISTHQIKKIAQVVQKTLKGQRVEVLGETRDVKLCLPRIRKNPVIAIVQICSGCNGFCAYCIVRLAKGQLFSYPKNKILEEISLSVKNGCKEIWLTAQDTAGYGLDLYNKSKLPELLKDITKIPGNFFVRVGMANPDNILPVLPELINAYNNKKIYKFLHIPVQSGDDDILKEMGRKYTAKQFEDVVTEFKKAFRTTIWTDMIIGYPGESEAQFKNSMSLLKGVRPDYVNISKFGKRPGTPADKLEQLKSEIVKRRSRIATGLVSQIALEKNKEWLDWEGEILITKKGKKPGQWLGRNFAYKPVLINKSGNLLGKMLKVKIIDASPAILTGWPIK